MLTAEIISLLKPLQSGVTLVITVGNEFRSDDGVGTYIANKIQMPKENIVILDAGDKPENIIDRAIDIKPARTIIIDAADFSGETGEVRLIPEDSIPYTTLTTHGFPLPIVSKMIAADTGSEVFFIGIQPGSVDFGVGLSPQVKQAADEIIELLKK